MASSAQMKDTYVPGIPILNIREFTQAVKKLYLGCVDKPGEMMAVAGYSKPGIGKSESMAKLAKHLGIGFKNVRLSQVFVTDIQGNPYNKELEDGEMKQAYSTPNYLPSVSLDGEKGILLLDELNMASNVIAGMIQQILDSGRIGSYVLPPGWMIVTCMNLRAHGCHVQELSTANNGRLVHFNIKEDLNVWIEDYAAIPSNNIEPLIVSYLREYPQHFYVLPQPGQKAYASPRTWKKTSTMLNCGLSEYSNSCIGDAISSSFNSFYSLKDSLPDWTRIGEKGYRWSWDKDKDISLPYAVTDSATARANPKTVEKLANFILDKFGVEYLQIFISSIIGRLKSTWGCSDRDMETARILSSCKLNSSDNIDVCEIFQQINLAVDEVQKSLKK